VIILFFCASVPKGEMKRFAVVEDIGSGGYPPPSIPLRRGKWITVLRDKGF